MRDVAALSFTAVLDCATGVGGVLATGAAVAFARGGGAVAASAGSLTGATVWGVAGGAERIVAGIAVRGAAGGAVRGAAGARVRRGVAGNAAAVPPAVLSGAVFAPGVVVARRRTGFGTTGVVGVASLVPMDSAAGLRLRGGFGRSGSSMHEV